MRSDLIPDAMRPAASGSKRMILQSGRATHVALARVGEYGEDHGSLGRFLRDFQRASHVRAAADAGEDAFHARQFLRGFDGFRSGDGHELVVQVHRLRVFQHLGNEIGGPALNRVRGERGVRPGGRATRFALGFDTGRDEAGGFGF